MKTPKPLADRMAEIRDPHNGWSHNRRLMAICDLIEPLLAEPREQAKPQEQTAPATANMLDTYKAAIEERGQTPQSGDQMRLHILESKTEQAYMDSIRQEQSANERLQKLSLRILDLERAQVPAMPPAEQPPAADATTPEPASEPAPATAPLDASVLDNGFLRELGQYVKQGWIPSNCGIMERAIAALERGDGECEECFQCGGRFDSDDMATIADGVTESKCKACVATDDGCKRSQEELDMKQKQIASLAEQVAAAWEAADINDKCLTESQETVATLTAELAEVRKQLPEGMEHCAIKFNECESGHGWLTATNWMDHGCPTCERDELAAELAAANQKQTDESNEYYAACELLNDYGDRYDTLPESVTALIATVNELKAQLAEPSLEAALRVVAGIVEQHKQKPGDYIKLCCDGSGCMRSVSNETREEWHSITAATALLQPVEPTPPAVPLPTANEQLQLKSWIRSLGDSTTIDAAVRIVEKMESALVAAAGKAGAK